MRLLKRLWLIAKTYFTPKKEWKPMDWEKEGFGDGYGY